MYMLLSVLPFVLAGLDDAKKQIFANGGNAAVSWSNYDNDKDGSITWAEFWDDIKTGGSNAAVSTKLMAYLKTVDTGGDGIDKGEFEIIGDALLNSEGDVSKNDADRTVRYRFDDPRDALDDHWMVKSGPTAAEEVAHEDGSRTFDDVDAEDGKDGKIGSAKMAEELGRMFFCMIGEFDRAGPEGKFDSGTYYATKDGTPEDKWNAKGFWKLTKPFGDLDAAGKPRDRTGAPCTDKNCLAISSDEFMDASRMGGGASFVETVEIVQTAVDASADKGSLVQDLEQQLRNLDAERDAILTKLHEQKQKQVPVRKGADTSDRKRGFREVEIRPETASKIIDTGDGAGVVGNL